MQIEKRQRWSCVLQLETRHDAGRQWRKGRKKNKKQVPSRPSGCRLLHVSKAECNRVQVRRLRKAVERRRRAGRGNVAAPTWNWASCKMNPSPPPLRSRPCCHCRPLDSPDPTNLPARPAPPSLNKERARRDFEIRLRAQSFVSSSYTVVSVCVCVWSVHAHARTTTTKVQVKKQTRTKKKDRSNYVLLAGT